jgi:hypothetical protein
MMKDLHFWIVLQNVVQIQEIICIFTEEYSKIPDPTASTVETSA